MDFAYDDKILISLVSGITFEVSKASIPFDDDEHLPSFIQITDATEAS